jgi:hypothetical protein
VIQIGDQIVDLISGHFFTGIFLYELMVVDVGIDGEIEENEGSNQRYYTENVRKHVTLMEWQWIWWG